MGQVWAEKGRTGQERAEMARTGQITRDTMGKNSLCLARTRADLTRKGKAPQNKAKIARKGAKMT